MIVLRNPVCAVVVTLTLLASPWPVSAQEEPGEDVAASAPQEQDVDSLLAQLADPDLRTWEATEARIIELWSRSGSDTADLLLDRGMSAIEAEDYLTAVEHLTALTDHAPDFAEGWHARATAFYLQDEYGLAMRDLEQALRLNPRHFGAFAGLGIVLEELGDYELALKAFELARDLNPHREIVLDAITRLKARIGQSTL